MFDVAKELTSIIRTQRVQASAFGNEIKRFVDKTLPRYIKTDLQRFAQMTINLVSNANKFTRNGKVEIFCSHMVG